MAFALRLRLLTVGLISLLCGSASTSAATEGPALYGCDRPIHLAYYEFGALFHAGVGIDPDVIEELSRRTGCVFDTEIKPRGQIWQELEAGTVDMTNSGIRTEARRKFAYFIPYLGWKNVVVTELSIAAMTSSFDEVLANPDWRIGVVKGYVHGPYYDFRLRIAAAEGRVIPYPDQDSIYQALKTGEVQVIISPAINYTFYLPTPEEQQKFVLVAYAPTPILRPSMVFSVKRFTNPQIDAWNRVFEQMRLDGTLERIYRKWLPANVAAAILHY